MEKAALLSAIKEQLGSTKLQFSDRTLDDYCSGIVETVGEGVELTDEFAASHANILKSFNGQYHADFSAELKKMRKAEPAKAEPAKTEPAKTEPSGGDEPKWFALYRKEQEERLEALEKENKSLRESRESERMSAHLEKNFRERLSSTGLRINEYVFKNSLRDVDPTDEKAIEKAEKLYNEGLASIGLADAGFPRAGSDTGGEARTSAERWFEAKHGTGKE